MLPKNVKDKIRRISGYLKFYDEHKFLPFEKKKISITLSGDILEKIKKVNNKSEFIENILRNNTQAFFILKSRSKTTCKTKISNKHAVILP